MQKKLQPPFDGLFRRTTFVVLCSQGIFWFSSQAYAHGDDSVTAASFIGPMLAVIVFVAVISLGKALLRMIIKKV